MLPVTSGMFLYFASAAVRLSTADSGSGTVIRPCSSASSALIGTMRSAERILATRQLRLEHGRSAEVSRMEVVGALPDLTDDENADVQLVLSDAGESQ